MKKVICTLGFMLLFISAYSQLMDLPGEYIRQKVVNRNLPSNTKGSPYYNDSFILGKVYTNENKFFEALLRYDAYNDEMQMKQNGNIIALLKFENGKVEIDNKTYEALSYTDDKGSNEIGYFENLTKPGNTKLLLHKSKKFVEGTKAQNSYTSDKPAMFKDDINYYLNKEGTLNLIKLSKKNILKLLSDKKKELDSYVSENKLKLRDELDFVQLINFYNSLQ